MQDLVITCAQCGESFESEEDLRAHEQAVHSGRERKPSHRNEEETVA
jgi:uncharacterized Zn-finger protein